MSDTRSWRSSARDPRSAVSSWSGWFQVGKRIARPARAMQSWLLTARGPFLQFVCIFFWGGEIGVRMGMEGKGGRKEMKKCLYFMTRPKRVSRSVSWAAASI
jgi:hypothetical protein